MNNLNYIRVATAIAYIKENYLDQPKLEQIAKAVNLSPFHFQRLFTEWAGVSPKKFIQFISIEHAKGILNQSNSSLLNVSYDIGLSGSSRLHDLFVNIEGMTPGEYKNLGERLTINYSLENTQFGQVLIASTTKGVCFMSFTDMTDDALNSLKSQFSKAKFVQQRDSIQLNAMKIYNADWSNIQEIKLHLKASDFQLKVWNNLLRIPFGSLRSYGSLATMIDQPKASRAVGTAVANNPVAFLIPCHRVIRSSGIIGEYRWGSTRKTALIGWESSKLLS